MQIVTSILLSVMIIIMIVIQIIMFIDHKKSTKLTDEVSRKMLEDIELRIESQKQETEKNKRKGK